MATALASQLAQIRASSTNPLDLKAQRRAHSRSLLFEPSVAAAQDFESLYPFCFEGFQEICCLDSRFAGFANSIFSEQSKYEDRTQMTVAQNQRLDVILEEFLHLIGSKLLLRCAHQAVEWLVRRFRIHEYNTPCLVFAFLPYHNTPIFPTMLSVIPQEISTTLKFLHPYAQSLTRPPRHAIVHAASSNRPFFSAMSAYVLRSCQLGLQHPALVSFWASISTEAVAAMLDQSRSARLEAQEQNQEDVVLILLPVLNSGISLDNVPDLRVGCYMILTLLATKANLDDGALSVMMEAVTSGWYQTSHAGLLCLGVLAEQKRTTGLPRKAFEAVIVLERLDDDLITISKHYRIDKLVLGVALGIVSDSHTARDASRLRLLKTLVEANVMSDASLKAVVKSVISALQTSAPSMSPVFNEHGSLADLILRLCDSENIGAFIHSTVAEMGFDLRTLGGRPPWVDYSRANMPEKFIEDVDMDDVEEQATADVFESLTSQIPTRTAYEISFLSHSDSFVYGSLAYTFLSIYTSAVNVTRFSELPVLRKSLGMTEPLFLSFFVRIWCGYGPAKARTAAIQTVINYFSKETLTADVQMIFPYILYALSDASPLVRRSAANLVLVLVPAYARMDQNGNNEVIQPILGEQQLYGQGGETQAVTWLSTTEAARIILELIVPELEDCMLDESHVSQVLSKILNGSKRGRGTNAIRKEVKSLRLALYSSICSHVVNTPLYSVKSRLLEMLNQVPKVGSTSRTKLLLPLLLRMIKEGRQKYESTCKEEQLDQSQLLDRIASIVSPDDPEGIQTLKSIIETRNNSNFPGLRAAAFHRLRVIWASIKIDLQLKLAKALFESAVSNGGSHKAEAKEMLRSLPLSTAVLQSFLLNLPSVSSTLPPVTKRRHTSHSHFNGNSVLDAHNGPSAIEQLTFALELVGDVKTELHPELLDCLFRVMSDLQHSQGHPVAAVDYLQLLVMEGILPIVQRAEVDRTVVRSDVLVDCIRTTTNHQVRNTALLLVSALANVTPESILHSVMPIFTFMGANVLRQDDDFSAYVVKQTMDSVIPCLLQSLREQKHGAIVGVSELLLCFVTAYEHTPSGRRLDLFASLVNKVGPSDYLFALIAMLLDKYPSDKSVMQFATDIISRYSLETRLQVVSQFLGLILDARNPKPTFSRSLLQLDDDDGAVSRLLPLAHAILVDTILVSKVSRKLLEGGEDSVTIRTLFADIVKDTLILSERIRNNEALNRPCMQLLDASLRLIPISQLIETLPNVLSRTEDNIRRQALRSLGHRLSDKRLDLKASQTGCLAFLPYLSHIVENSSDMPLKRTAIVCTDRIAELFGKKDIAAIVASARVVAGDGYLRASEDDLRIVSMLCLATMVEVLSHSFISVLPLALPKALDSLATSLGKNTENSTLHNAVYSFLGALILYVPWMVTGADLTSVLKLSFGSASAEMGEECDQSRIEALRLVPRQAEAKDCLAALDRSWVVAMMEGPRAVKEHIEILRLTIDRQPKSNIARFSETLGGLFLTIFDLRRIQLSLVSGYSYDTAEIKLIEDIVNESAISMVYKLNNVTFRPIFLRMLGWSTTIPASKDMMARIHRQTTWYNFLFKFFGTLKSIVTDYAAFIIDDTVEILKDVSLNDEHSIFLRQQAILTLKKTFEHDQDSFYQSPVYFAPISAALLGQLGNTQNHLFPELIPAITELAVATDSAIHHKEMNAVILKSIRSDKAAVRLAAVQCERALAETLGEEWLASLPEMLPFINEALEDDNEAVEKEVQMWIAGIEGILGESLGSMLQ